MSEVFLSYAHEDAPAAKRIQDKLQSQGNHVFTDVGSLVAGEDWSKAITKSLSEASSVVLLLSEHSKPSRWVDAELRNALRSGQPIVPVLLDDDAKNNWVWPLVADFQAVTVSSAEDMNNLGETVSQAVKRQTI